MLKYILLFFVLVIAHTTNVLGQCSVCSRTAEQLDPTAAEGFNLGVLYLMATPLLIIATIGFLWYKKTHIHKS